MSTDLRPRAVPSIEMAPHPRGLCRAPAAHCTEQAVYRVWWGRGMPALGDVAGSLRGAWRGLVKAPPPRAPGAGVIAAASAATESIRWRAATSLSGAVTWRTPPALYRPLHQEFDFTLDVAADEGNAVCDRFLDREDDALAQSWAGERVFCNPPYGRDLDRWVKKALEESRDAGALVVMVLPARTGNAWFHRWVLPYAEIRFIAGRLNFTLGGGGRKNAPFDSMVVVYRPGGVPSLAAQPTFPFHSRGTA